MQAEKEKVMTQYHSLKDDKASHETRLLKLLSQESPPPNFSHR